MLSTRSAMCANGRYETPTLCGGSREVDAGTRHSYSAMRWVMTPPLGRPVVPEVYSTASVAAGVRSCQREQGADPSARNDSHAMYGAPAGQSFTTMIPRS